MQNIIVDKTPVNVELLDYELRAALETGLMVGISTGKGKVTLHMDDNATQANIDAATAIVVSHDHAVTTSRQDAQAAQDSRIAFARIIYVGNLLDVPQANLTAALERINWLQDEVERLSGLVDSQ